MTKKIITSNVDHPDGKPWYQVKKLLSYRIILASVLVLSGVGLLMPRIAIRAIPAPPPNFQEIITEDTANPSENFPSTDATYTVPANQPRRIIIKSIGVSGFVQRIGKNSQNAVSVPNNIHYAGWYVDSVAPGDNGLSIIDGHVSGRYTDGIFKKLKNIVVNDIVSIEFGDGSIKNFSVFDTTTINVEEATTVLFEQDKSTEQQLNIITCGGTYNTDTQSYTDRVIVKTKLLDY
jgi:sortase (surface protein transpeptidase)